jgi:predicted HAD superfamily Cof-like phosphohydrolase
MKDAEAKVREFHVAMGQRVGDQSAPNCTVDLEMRVRLIAEEFDELLLALGPGHRGRCNYVTEAIEDWLDKYNNGRWIPGAPHDPSVADALADLAYVTVGANVAWGLPAAEVFDEVHRSNMAKQGGERRADGKILKPAGWTPPDVAGVLARKAGR